MFFYNIIILFKKTHIDTSTYTSFLLCDILFVINCKISMKNNLILEGCSSSQFKRSPTPKWRQVKVAYNSGRHVILKRPLEEYPGSESMPYFFF